MADTVRPDTPLILASASAGRAALLRASGLAFEQMPAGIDERALQQGAGLPAGGLAALLAAEKAKAVSRRHPDALVIGADQVMEQNGRLHLKPPDLNAAREQLRLLRGKEHGLHAGLSIARGGETRWGHVGVARLTMRNFSDAFLDSYLAAEGDALIACVGAYRIEGRGIQLFSRIEGDHSTIIGLPLLPLLGYLRGIGWLAS